MTVNWRNSHEACAEYQRLDRKFGTGINSPLHHNQRCPIHGGAPAEEPRTIPLILAPPMAKDNEPRCEVSIPAPGGEWGRTGCTLKPHPRGTPHVSHGTTSAVTWGD